MRQQTAPKKVKFTKKVSSKTTVTTNAPLKSCLKQPPRSQPRLPGKQLFSQGPKPPPGSRITSGDKKGWRTLSVSRFAAPPDQGCINADSPSQTSSPVCQPGAPMTGNQQQNLQQMRDLHKMQLFQDRRWGKKKCARQGRYDVLPIVPEKEELKQYSLPPDRGRLHYKKPQRPMVCGDGPMQKPAFLRSPPSPTPDFNRYHKFLDNYAPYTGDWSGDVPPTPPCSPIEDYGQELYYDWDCVKIPVDEGQQYGPTCPVEELLDDPAFYPLAGSMVEGGLMDMMPRVNLPEPLMPVPFQGVGPSHHGFHQPLSKARHKMVGWHDREPEVHLYRPDLPTSAPYEPYSCDHEPEEEGDLIGLLSPPPPPSQAELRRLRYTPPPASPPHHPYRGMLGEDTWNVPVTMPWPPERQYSPQRLPINFSIPQPPPPGPTPPVCLDQSPDYDMGEARWFHKMLTGQTTPPHLREYQPRRIFQGPSNRRHVAAQQVAAQRQQQACGAGGIRIRSPQWVPPHLREEEPCDLDDTDEWRRQQQIRMEEELDRRMRKYGVGQYRKDEYFEQLRHCYDPMDRAPWAPPMSAGPSTWLDKFKFPSPPTPRTPSPSPPRPAPCPTPQPQPISDTPRRAPAAGARRPVSARQAPSSGGRPPGACRTGPPGSGGPPRRRQPPPVPQFKEKMKIDKLPEHLKGQRPKEMTQRSTPDDSQNQAKQQALAAAKARQAKAREYAAQQREANRSKKC